MANRRILIYADGGCERNGKKDAKAYCSYAGYVLRKSDYICKGLHMALRNRRPVVHCKKADLILDRSITQPTNNLAEASALEMALGWLARNNWFNDDCEAHICMDSQLALSQFTGIYNINNKNLFAVYQRTYKMLENYPKHDKVLNFIWISGDVMKASVIGH